MPKSSVASNKIDHKILRKRGLDARVVTSRNKPKRGQHAIFVLDADDCDVRPLAGRGRGCAGTVPASALKRKPRPLRRGSFSSLPQLSGYSQYVTAGNLGCRPALDLNVLHRIAQLLAGIGKTLLFVQREPAESGATAINR
jgi:hypothetical protein